MKRTVLFVLVFALLAVPVLAQSGTQDKMIVNMPVLNPYYICCDQYNATLNPVDNSCCDSSDNVTACYQCIVEQEGTVAPYYAPRQGYINRGIDAQEVANVLLVILLIFFPLSFIVWVIDGIMKLVSSKGFLPKWLKVLFLSMNALLLLLVFLLSGAPIAYIIFLVLVVLSCLLLLSDWIVHLINKKGYLGKGIKITCWIVLTGTVLFILIILGSSSISRFI